jgi:hypothetical protein
VSQKPNKKKQDRKFSRVLTRNADRIAEWVELNWSEERILQSLGGVVKRSELRNFIEISRESDAEDNPKPHQSADPSRSAPPSRK